MTCHALGWQDYGRNMAKTFVEFWPGDVSLEIYAEGFDIDVAAPNVLQRRLPEWFDTWKARHAENPDANGRNKARFGRIAQRKATGYDYRRDCVRFAHKVAALTDAALEHMPADPDMLIMCDADVVTHEVVTVDWLKSMFSDPRPYLAWLYRSNWYPECGFVMYRETHRAHMRFMHILRDVYESDKVFKLQETHDSFVLQQIVRECIARGMFSTPFSLSGRIGERASHPFVHSRLAERLDHAKGKFKGEGRTPRGYVQRPEEHWK